MALAEVEYKWCPRCSGGIRADARYCRFCKNELVSSESLGKRAFFGPDSKFETARRWLPNIDDLIFLLPDCAIKRHFLRGMSQKGRYSALSRGPSDREAERRMIESNVGLERPPFDQEKGIILDLFICLLDNGFDIAPVLDTAKMRVLEITYQKVKEERALRLEAECVGKTCQFCAEPNLAEARNCRYCQSDFIHPPRREPRRFKRGVVGFFPIDNDLLRQVIVYIAVNEAFAGEPWKEKLKRHLEMNGIKDDEVIEALRQRQYLLTEDMEVPLPTSEWQQRLLKEGLDDGMHGYHAIHNLIELGQTLVAEARYEEAELVLNFAMACADNCLLGNIPGLDAMREPLKTSGWLALSQLYEVTERYAEAEKAHSEMFQMRLPMPIPGLDEIMKATMDLLSPQRAMRKADLCFKQGKFDEAVALYKTALESLDLQESKPFAALSNLSPLLDQEGEAAEEDSDELSFSEKDQSRLNEMADLVQVSTAHRVGLLKKLAEVYIAKRELEDAEKTLEEANQLCEQLVDPYQALVADVAEKYGELCCLQERYDEAPFYFEQALEYYVSVKEPLDPDEFARVLSDTHEKYAACLERLNRSEEADYHRQRARELTDSMSS